MCGSKLEVVSEKPLIITQMLNTGRKSVCQGRGGAVPSDSRLMVTVAQLCLSGCTLPLHSAVIYPRYLPCFWW